MNAPLCFDPIAHRYTIGDRVLPSVTQITGTIASLAGIPPAILEAKRDLGTAVHLATQFFDEDDLDRDALPAEVLPYLDAYIRFRDETGFAPTQIEQRVHHVAFGYAGTLDRIGYFSKLKGLGIGSGKMCLIDLKATYRIAPVYGVQTALYAAAAHDTPRDLRRFALQLRPNGAYTLREFADPADLSVGLAALTLMNWKERHHE